MKGIQELLRYYNFPESLKFFQNKTVKRLHLSLYNGTCFVKVMTKLPAGEQRRLQKHKTLDPYKVSTTRLI